MAMYLSLVPVNTSTLREILTSARIVYTACSRGVLIRECTGKAAIYAV